MSEEQPAGAVVDAEAETMVEPETVAEAPAEPAEGALLGATKIIASTPDDKKVPQS